MKLPPDGDAAARRRLRIRITGALALSLVCVPGVTHANEGPAPLAQTTQVRVFGLDRTQLDTVLGLLPRSPPAAYSDAELREFERRLANLGIFDSVVVVRTDGAIDVRLREKWTLIPMVDFATGSSWKDTYVALAVTEYNLLGAAAQLEASVWHEARGWNGLVGLNEHVYHPTRGSFGGSFEYSSATLEFADSEAAWVRYGGGVDLRWQAPMPIGSAWSYAIGADYGYEHNTDAATRYKPPNGNSFAGRFIVSWENLRWDDLAPSGILVKLELSPGAFFTEHAPQPRMSASAYSLLSAAFTRTTALMAQVNAIAMNRGNANFSTLLGSFDGVRGLEDSLYHTWLQAVLNVELRQAVRFAERWAVQFVLFGDAAVFDEVDSRGERSDAGFAVSTGLGFRIIPTFLADVVLRVDVARALAPEPGFVWQWGLSQYF